MGSSAKTGGSGSAQGRPRDPAVDQAILRAALELFIEHGIAGASIEKIAKQAGVAKTSIYRRWSSREALLAQAIEVARNATGYTVDLLERTSPRDFIKLLVEACEVIAKPEIRNLMARLIGSAPDYPKLLAVYRETYYLPRRLAFVRALERVQTAGLLATNIDLETLVDMLIGALTHRLLMSSPGENSVSEFRDHMIKLLRQAGFDVLSLRRAVESCAPVRRAPGRCLDRCNRAS
jgi:AcrR family transcriptional regulator